MEQPRLPAPPRRTPQKVRDPYPLRSDDPAPRGWGMWVVGFVVGMAMGIGWAATSITC